ncbi:hypothetical protein [Phreatobacter stygius]|uniref:Lipoprotein n=1 Tax=Phreatobacter stygius TaxID=1940610 RepID=A0A4D7B6C1_9HYPH|nr:hypothetical protein [Phreatobacter stygius]QCI63742.1 hypothetical protein E8M01_05480 [Phreatobacter stygius]
MPRNPLHGSVALLLGSLALGACTGGEGPVAGSPPARGAIAFEPIDGAPSAVNQRLAGRLAGEAQARQIQVVANRDGARYRVRGYMATARSGDTATVSYVWDVFDPERRRSTRIAGEERVQARGGDGWGGLDDAAAGRIASRSMDQIASWLATPQAGPAVAPASAPVTPAEPAPPAQPMVASTTGTAQVTTFASPQAAPAAAPPQSTVGTGGPLIPAQPLR